VADPVYTATAVTRRTLSDQVADGIVDMLVARGLGPDESIGSEQELAAQFGVSKLVVREAIRTLAARGILRPSQGKPATVQVPGSDILAQLLEFRMHFTELGLEDLLATRRLIEGELAFEAAADPAGAWSTDARAALDRMRAAVGELDRFIAADLDFHRAIAWGGRNELLRLVLESLEGLLLTTRQATMQGRAARGKDDAGVIAAHARILDAIEAGDAEGARDAMHAHLDETLRDLRAAPPLDG
jgi:GntR family transcriptional regulator, transcriptional repressor for pyruvate dehydrogenase complex